MTDSGPEQTGGGRCPNCEVELVHGHDRHGYEMLQCPGCARWKRPSWDRLMMPDEGEPTMEDGGEARADGGQPETEPDDRLIYEIWEDKAEENISEWGIQDPAVVLLAMQEELGELTKAYLEATYEGGDRDLPREEMHDLGALLYQLHWALSEHPRAFTEVGEL